VEGAKHLRRADAGAALGTKTIPELSTLRARLAALGDGCDPLALQRAFAAGMVAFDPADDPVYFVDDHFVAYAGARPVAKGWNTRRRHAEAGRDDTLLTDARGRAVVFSSAEPTGLSSTLPGVLAQLRAVIGAATPVLLGFDRGGAYPVAFRACRDAGADWVTYRRAPLVDATATPKRSWSVRDGRRITVTLADELVQINRYGTARQLTLYEHGQAVLQVLTSDLGATGAYLVSWLRSRWRIENVFKYASAQNGIDSLADYRMDIGPDTRLVANPARTAARKAVADAEAALAAAERALPQLLTGPGTPAHKNAELPKAHRRIAATTTELAQARQALRPLPAKIAATDIDPDTTRARPRLEHRGLQMVLRLLAFNAEAWAAEHLNAYLADPDEYRAHLAASTNYTAAPQVTHTVTVTVKAITSPPLMVTTSSLPTGTVGVGYTATLEASGNSGAPLTWSLAPGSSLPPGLGLASNGRISGTPSAAGSYPFTVSVNDPATKALSITIKSAPPVTAAPNATADSTATAAPTSGTATGPGGRTEPQTSVASNGPLAFTGLRAGPLILAGVALILLGVDVVLLAGWRRRLARR